MRLLLLAALALPAYAAADSATTGDRTIRGLIKPRDEARKIYDDAGLIGAAAAS
jgi:hypothetical protein